MKINKPVVNFFKTTTVFNIYLYILILIFISFFYFGLTSTGFTSQDYNVPIARLITTGKIVNPQSNEPYLYFPGASHVILAILILLHIPLNLFGLLSVVILFIVCRKLGLTFGLSPIMAFIFAASICTTITVIRTISDQSIDKWLCAWFFLTLILLKNPQKTIKWSLYIGITSGMLIGTKYSGPLFLLSLLPIYLTSMRVLLHPVRFLITVSAFTITGLCWYMRNWIVTGNPLFPANIPFFKGYPNFTQQDWQLWRVPIDYPPGVIDLANAFISEYMIWAFAGGILLYFLYFKFKKNSKVDRNLREILCLCFTTAFVCLLLPVTPAEKIELFHIISDMRYLMIFVVLTILGIFYLAMNFKKEEQLASLSLLNAIPLFSFIPWQPKLSIIGLGIFFFILKRHPKSR